MPNFQYKAKQGPEKLLEGVIEAPNETVAIERISQQGLVPISVTPYQSTPEVKTSHVVLTSTRRRNLEVAAFSRHLASLLRSGVPVFKALHTLADQEKDGGFKRILKAFCEDISKGRTLSQSMERYPGHFSRMYVAILKAGEASGTLQESLVRMATHLKKDEDLRSKVKRALAYPVFLGTAGAATIFFIMAFMIPKLTGLFGDIGEDLPLATRWVMGASQGIQQNWPVLLILLISSFYLIPKIFYRYIGKAFLDGLLLRLPFVGELVMKIEFSRFARTLELSLSNGLGFLQALRTAIPSIDNQVLRTSIEDCYRSVEKGSSFGSALKKKPYFSQLIAGLVAIGEESGRLAEVMSEISDTYDSEVDDLVGYLTTLLEPAMILVIGGIVGFIVMAMLLPVFEMNLAF